MPYILNTPAQIKEILKELGLSSEEELFSQIPESIKIKEELFLPGGMSEKEVSSAVRRIGKQNRNLNEFNSFLGAGLYDHYIPSALKHIINRSEFYTAYTPYQPECSQGVLQAIYEYQSFICLLTGMDVTNASMYDGATSLAESVLMSLRITKKNRILIAKNVHPEYRDVLRTYIKYLDYKLIEVPYNKNGLLDTASLKELLDSDTASVVIQNPNFFGLIEDIPEIKSILKDINIKLIVVLNPLSLAILKKPSEYGADIVCADGQPLGGDMSFGGPTFGIIATKKEYVRQLPGRIVGRTKDLEGKDAFCLTLQAREQHIRRQNATSNICSNQSLNAIAAAVYLSLMGKDGLHKAAIYSLNNAHYLYNEMRKIKGVTLPFSNIFFNEFVWHIDSAKDAAEKLAKEGILAGVELHKFYPELSGCILSCCTEKKTKQDIDNFITALKNIAHE
ncbi:MAG: glycine dehydrogenase (aminomethyl-transferring) [Candidatus Omnitrophica bacterium 4484_171]|nr:MAG: glycine dehydrogenase (aminomethyl-transferring) [Candidatus Omnitrophica bacterium 4484_171]